MQVSRLKNLKFNFLRIYARTPGAREKLHRLPGMPKTDTF